MWETVSAFSNTSGGWIVLGIKQNGKRFEIQGVSDGEKMESDFLNVLHGGQKFNMRLTAKGRKYDFDGKKVIPFNTHEGSGDAGTYETIKTKLPNAKVNTNGFNLDGKTARSDEGKTQTIEWLKEIGY